MSMRVLALSGLLAIAVTAPALAKQFNQPARLDGGSQLLILQAEAKARAEGRKIRAAGEEIGADDSVTKIGTKDVIFNNQCGDQNVGVVEAGADAPRNLIISADAIINVCRR